MYWKYGIGVEQRGLFGAEAANYTGGVMMHLRWIEESEVGGLLLRAIAREVLSAPPGNLRAFTDPVAPGQPTRGVLIRPYHEGKCNATENSALVEYTPWMQKPCSHFWTSPAKNRGFLPHEILFHELVHALRDAAGHGWSLTPLTGALKRYHNTEEFIAVVTTNIYMTDPSNKRADRVGLRKDHTKGKLENEFSDSLEFFKVSTDVFRNIEQFCKEDPWFTSRLAEVPSTFNPVNSYYHKQAEARSNSNSLRAILRDAVPVS